MSVTMLTECERNWGPGKEEASMKTALWRALKGNGVENILERVVSGRA